jgi:5-hydroxyisourate hydrolase
MSVSAHVLDATTGLPASGIGTVLRAANGDPVNAAEADGDGRIRDLAGRLPTGTYRLTFDTDRYFNGATFYPEVVIVFRVDDPDRHLHVALLLSPYAYSTYRGS